MSGERNYVCKLSQKTLDKARKELHEDPRQRASQIDTLRNWVKAQPHIRSRTDDLFLLGFLRAAKFSQLRAQQVLENYWTVRSVQSKGAPDWFENLTPNDPKIQEVLDLGIAVPLPEKDDEGRQVVLIRTDGDTCRFYSKKATVAGAYDAKKYSVADILRVAFLNNDAMLMDEENQIHGFVTILDFTDFSSSHVWYYTRETIQKAIRCYQDTYPMRFRGSHYVNTPTIFNAVFEIFLYFAREKSRKRMIVHKHNLESLHKKVPKRILPTHLGGDAGPISDIAKTWKDHLLKHEAEFENNLQYGIDETKIPKRDKQSDHWGGVTGAFRKLDLD